LFFIQPIPSSSSSSSLENEERILSEKLIAIQRERELLRVELSELEDESRQLDEYEQEFWKEYQDAAAEMNTLK
jgi:hypothetical protein